jgi:phage host-nuclease inhibitor protein Gam
VRLYEIASEYMQLQALAESGEDVGPMLATVDVALAEKAQGVVYVLKNLEAEAEAFRAEETRLAARRQTLERAADQIRDRVRSAMAAGGVTRVKAGTFSISLSEGCERVEVEDAAAVPEAFHRVKREIDKSAILRAYKSDGEVPAGINIVRGTRLVIR